MKIKIFLMSVLISISNSAFASDEDFNIELGSTPITTITIKQDNVKELRNYYKVSSDARFSAMSDTTYHYHGFVEFFINDGRIPIQYGVVYGGEPSNGQYSSKTILDEFNTWGIKQNINNNSRNSFTISSQYLLNFFRLTNNNYYGDEFFISKNSYISKHFIVIKYSDNSGSVIPITDVYITASIKDFPNSSNHNTHEYIKARQHLKLPSYNMNYFK